MVITFFKSAFTVFKEKRKKTFKVYLKVFYWRGLRTYLNRLTENFLQKQS